MTETSSGAANGGALGTPRLGSIDMVRGLVMVIMALDHTRDFLSNAPFDPTDLAHTNPALFFTRWITHFCAPVFVLLAGTGAYLSTSNGKSTLDLARFLATRGLWLVFLEVFVITPLGWSFNWDFSFVRMQVFWAIGASMVVLAGLVPILPRRVIGALGLMIVLGHNLLDGAHADWLGPLAPAWRFLHTISPVPLAPHKMLIFLYPLAPWFGVMALGYGFGDLIQLEANRRRATLLILGTAMIALFLILRGPNLYGDPKPWIVQPSSVMTALSWINATKYPPSLIYLLMTLGPAMIVLALIDRAPAVLTRTLATFGRVPLFYYLLHLPLIHGIAVLLSQVRYGQSRWLLHDMMAQKGAAFPLPHGYGYDLWVVYAVWLAVVVALYPACHWFAGVKQRNRNPLLSYL
jgi:uncharacterized membrane protein